MLFKTESGSVYELNLETNRLKRMGVRPLKSVVSGEDMAEPDGDIIQFSKMPTIGESFFYYHPTLYGCGSTPVIEIEMGD